MTKRKADSITPSTPLSVEPTFEPASPNKPASTVLEGTPSTPPADYGTLDEYCPPSCPPTIPVTFTTEYYDRWPDLIETPDDATWVLRCPRRRLTY